MQLNIGWKTVVRPDPNQRLKDYFSFFSAACGLVTPD
jgi:hypothetical protein